MMTQGDRQFGEIERSRSFIAELLGIEEGDLADLPIQTVTTAMPKLLVPVASLQVLRKIKPKFDNIAEYSRTHTAQGFYCFVAETANGGDLSTRFFNPLIGINEDPATGVAAGAVGCYADRYIFKNTKKQLIIEQGFDMGQSSTIYVDITNKVLVGGYGVSFGTRDLEV